MNCVICKTGKTHPGYTTVMLNRSGSTIIIKKVPADICDNCGEYYLSSDMTDRVLRMAENALHEGAEIELLIWAA